MDSAAKSGSPQDYAIADLAWIAFFFLLRPGEYYAGGTDTVTTPFNLRDIQFLVGNQPFQATTASAATCAAATFVSILFTTQKNGVKGESIGHGATGNPRACAVASIRRRVAHLRQHGATPDTHFAAVFNGTTWSTVCSALRAATTLMGPRWDSLQKTSARNQCGPAAPWPSSWHVLTQTRSASWVGGAATSCCATSTRRHRRSRKDYALIPPTHRTKTPAPRLWASPKPLLGYSGRPGIGLVRIREINLPYQTNVSKSIPSSSADTQIPLAGKVALATVTSREKGGTMHTRARTGTHAPFQILRR